jgi:hypothetical protein
VSGEIVFPPKLMRELDHDWNIVGNTATAGVATGAAVDIRSDGGGFWSAALNNIQFIDQSYTLLWRAVRQLCNGGTVPIVVPRNDATFAPFPAGPRSYGLITHSDGTLFSDGSGYVQSMIDVKCDGGAALRATAMEITLSHCGPLQGGESFSVNHETFGWRLYEVATAIVVDSTHTNITFNPPLREAVQDGDALEFDQPRCTMKLVDAAGMNLNVTTWPFSLAAAKFVESRFR